MSVFPNFNDDQEPEIIEIKAGDAVGDDLKLERNSKVLADKLNEASPSLYTSFLKELLDIFGKPISFTVRKTIDSLSWIQKRLSSHNVREATANELNSVANINNAKATAIEKKTESEVSTQTMQTEMQYTELQMKQIAFLEKHDIEWYAKYEKGVLKVIVSKPKPRN